MFSLSLSPEYASRKFIDLIKNVTTKWANWDPGHSIKVGDYGTIDKKTGVFDKEGNIYEDLHIYRDDEAWIRELVEKNPPIAASRENEYIATTSNATRGDLKVDQHASIPGLAEAAIKGQWTFDSRRGALLIMARPQSSYIPPGKLLEHLVKVKALKDMRLVTQVFFCPAYNLYLSSKNKDVVNLALLGSAPIPHAPGATASGEVSVKWWSSNTTGLIRNGHEPNGKDDYAPLYTLKKIRTKGRSRRGIPDPVYEGDELWADPEPPWDLLDEEGNEDPVVDTIFDSDSE